MSLEVSIIVPDRVFWKDQAQEIIFPTITGQMGVLENHIPLLTGLDTGVMKVRQNADEWIAIAIMGGFALVNENKITVLVNGAAVGADIDAQEAESAFVQAKANLEKAAEGKDKREAEVQYKKALARFEVTKPVEL
jgi:F-type H+-transporting ATPase subunit epsilon